MTWLPNTGLMLAQRHRRVANISPASGQHLVFARAAAACMIETAGHGHGHTGRQR